MKKIFTAIIFISTIAFAEEKIKMNFKNAEIIDVIEHYSKASGRKFIIDSTVRGKVTLLNNDDVTLDEAFNQIAEALALNGFSYVNKNDIYTIKNARSIQRDGIEVSEKLPSEKPQRMATWIVKLKHISVNDIKHQFGRLMNSSYGEVESSPKTNQLIINDFTSSLHRIAELIEKVDQPVDAATQKIIDAAAKNKKSKTEEKSSVPKVSIKSESKNTDKVQDAYPDK